MPDHESDQANQKIRKQPRKADPDPVTPPRGQVGLCTIHKGQRVKPDQVHPRLSDAHIELGRNKDVTKFMDHLQEWRDQAKGQQGFQVEYALKLNPDGPVVRRTNDKGQNSQSRKEQKNRPPDQPICQRPQRGLELSDVKELELHGHRIDFGGLQPLLVADRPQVTDNPQTFTGLLIRQLFARLGVAAHDIFKKHERLCRRARN